MCRWRGTEGSWWSAMNKELLIVLNKREIGNLLKSQEMLEVLKTYARNIADEAGNAEVDTSMLNTRVRAGVVQRATRDDLDHNSLMKAVHFQS